MELLNNIEALYNQLNISNLVALLSLLPLWAGFVFNDYLYEIQYCKYFKIDNIYKNEYKIAFHPKYLLNILSYTVAIVSIYVIIRFTNLGPILSKYHNYFLWGGIFGVIITDTIFLIKIKKQIKIIENSEKEDYKNRIKFNELTKKSWNLIKVTSSTLLLLIFAVFLSQYYSYTIVVLVLSCLGSIIFYGIVNDCYADFFGLILRIKSPIVYTIDYINVIDEDNKSLYALLIPNNKIISDEYILAKRVYFYKKKNGLTTALIDMIETKIYNSLDSKKIHRFDINYIGTIDNPDSFYVLSDEQIDKLANIAYKNTMVYRRGIWDDFSKKI